MGVAFVDLLLRGAGFAVNGRSAPGHDLIVEQTKVQVRFSTLWSAGWYTFQKIRDVGDYEWLVLLGLSPDGGHAWVVPRATAITEINASRQAGWWQVDPVQPPDALGDGAMEYFVSAAAAAFGVPSAPPHGPAKIDVLDTK